MPLTWETASYTSQLITQVKKHTDKKPGVGQAEGGVGASPHPAPPTYLDNFQTILKTYESHLTFKDRTARGYREGFSLLTR